MLGKPKYKLDDNVSFEIDGKTVKGRIYIILYRGSRALTVLVVGRNRFAASEQQRAVR